MGYTLNLRHALFAIQGVPDNLTIQAGQAFELEVPEPLGEGWTWYWFTHKDSVLDAVENGNRAEFTAKREGESIIQLQALSPDKKYTFVRTMVVNVTPSGQAVGANFVTRGVEPLGSEA